MANFYNDEDGAKIKGTSKADTINNIGSNVSISGGNGNDSIENGGGDNVTISGGKGNNFINSWGEGMAYVYGGGNDTINGFRFTSSLVLGKAKINSSVMSDENGDVTLTMSDGGSVILNGYWDKAIATVTSVKDVEHANIIRAEKSKAKINGTSGRDVILVNDENFSNVTINAGAGNDFTGTNGKKHSVDLGDGNDVAENSGDGTTISGGKGNDEISNWEGSDVSISGGKGNDSINNGGDNVTISGGKGNNFINSWGEGMAYVYGGGNDTIDGFRMQSTLVLGKTKINSSVMSDENGDVTLSMSDGGSVILNGYWDKALNTVASVKDVEHLNVVRADKSKTKLNGTSGKDVILVDDENFSNVTINAGAGNDYTRTNGTKHFVDLGEGNDIAENWASDTTINGGKGNDEISNWEGSDVSISGGAGNDTINNGGDNVTISGGKGNNFINSWGEGMAYVYGGGNDTVDGFGMRSTLVLGKAKINSSVMNNDGDVTLTMGDGGSILLKQYWKDTINTVASAKEVEHLNIIRNEKNKAKIKGTSGNDFIISTGEWNNEQNIMLGYSNVKITAGAGRDYTNTSGTKNSVDLGDGDDVAENWGSYTTINGGNGNDYIENYREGGDYASLVGGAGDDSLINHAQYSTVDGGDGNDYIDNHDKYVSLSGGAGNDTIINDWTSFNTISGGTGDDYIDGRGNGLVYVYGGGNDTISQFDSNDTIVLGSVKVNSSVRADDTITLNLSNKKTLTLTNYWSNAVNVVKSIKDIPNFIENYEDGKKIKGTSKADRITNEGSQVSINAGKGNDLITNWGFNTTINGGAGDDTVDNSEAGMVYVYKSGDGNDLINGFGILETLVVDGAKYSTVKSDSDVLVNVGKNTITLSGAAGLANVNIVSSAKGIAPVNVVRNETAGETIEGKSTPNWIRNFADNVTIQGGASTDDIYNDGSNVVIQGGGGYDQIRSYNSNVSILGGAKADVINSYGSNNTINAGKGNDTIYAGGEGLNLMYKNGDGKDVIYMGNGLRGADVTVNLTSGTLGSTSVSSAGDIVLKVGKGSLTFKEAQGDKISVKDSAGKTTVVNTGRTATENTKNNKTITKTTGDRYIYNSGNKVKITTGDGSDGIENHGSKVTINSAAGNDNLNSDGNNVSINAGAGSDTIYNFGGSKTTILGGAGSDTIYNHNKELWDAQTDELEIFSPDNVSIDGGGGNDRIFNAGDNVTINGGKGNDSLWGGSGADIFIYTSGGGNDIIYGFDDKDTLTLDSLDFTATYKNKAVTLTFDEGSVIFKDFTAKTFHINSDVYQITGKNKFVKK